MGSAAQGKTDPVSQDGTMGECIVYCQNLHLDIAWYGGPETFARKEEIFRNIIYLTNSKLNVLNLILAVSVKKLKLCLHNLSFLTLTGFEVCYFHKLTPWTLIVNFKLKKYNSRRYNMNIEF